MHHLDGKTAHEPWKYGGPRPIVDHTEARQQALRRYDAIRGA
ncbi:hypothetical protein [Kribbella antiqua]